MSKFKLIFALAASLLVLVMGWQVGACELANTELQDDLVDLAAQPGIPMGLDAARNDDELRNAVIRKAGQYGIQLTPEQVTVRQTLGGHDLYLAADYEAHVGLLGLDFSLHFTPSSAGKKR
jgi:hypothetical protein